MYINIKGTSYWCDRWFKYIDSSSNKERMIGHISGYEITFCCISLYEFNNICDCDYEYYLEIAKTNRCLWCKKFLGEYFEEEPLEPLEIH